MSLNSFPVTDLRHEITLFNALNACANIIVLYETDSIGQTDSEFA